MSESVMNLFLSWSGPKSRAVAASLYNWLPQVINAARPWMSSEDIRKGSRWSQALSTELAEARIGIVCVTRENSEAPWILFEAGAISKMVDHSYVCTYLLDLKPTDVPLGPLTQFQATVAEREDTRKLLTTISAALGHPRTEGELDRAFAKWWPDLEGELAAIRQMGIPQATVRRGVDDMTEEILSIVRQLAQVWEVGSEAARARTTALQTLFPDTDDEIDASGQSDDGPRVVTSSDLAGKRVNHPKYGMGVVVRQEGKDDDTKVTVNFPRYGLKKLMAKFAGPLVE
jgi:hypothetical protein